MRDFFPAAIQLLVVFVFCFVCYKACQTDSRENNKRALWFEECQEKGNSLKKCHVIRDEMEEAE